MRYKIDRILEDADFEEVDNRTGHSLTDHGFGVLREIDVKATMRKKLDKEMSAYRILGACNPAMAWGSLGVEPRVGAMLPCNVILRETSEGIEVSAIDPVASMTAIENSELNQVAGKVKEALSEVIAGI